MKSSVKSQNFIFGIRPLIEAIEEGKGFEKVLIKKGLRGPLADELKSLLIHHKIYYQQVPVEKLNRTTRKNHQGVVAFIAPITYYKIEDILPYIFEQGRVPLIVIMDRVTDVRNLGAISRTADCAGVDAIVIPEKGSAMINEDAIKTSAGALLRIPVCKVDNLENTLKFIRNSGLQIIGGTEGARTIYTEIDYQMPTAILLGSEEDGISKGLFKYIDKAVKIPINGKTASLNVSVAAGVLVYEAVRQRGRR